MNKILIKLLFSFLILIAWAVPAHAVNNVVFVGDADFQILTTDTVETATFIGLTGGQVVSMSVNPNYVDIVLEKGSSLALRMKPITPPSFFFNVERIAGFDHEYQVSAICPTQEVGFSATGDVTVRIRINSVPGCASAGVQTGSGGSVAPSYRGPVNYSAVFNSGKSLTRTRTIQLDLRAGNASHVIVSDNSSFLGAQWETFISPMIKPWDLGKDGGLKNVYVRFRSPSLLASPVLSAMIEYIPDPTIPDQEPDEDKVEPDAPSTVPKAEEPAKPPITEEAKKKAAEFADQVKNIISEASSMITGKLSEFIAKVNAKRSIPDEENTVEKYVGPLKEGIEEELKPEVETALTNFVTYGTPTTLKLGAGERAGVVSSYKSAFGKLPETEDDWSDAIKIGNGRWPTQRNEEKEAKALESFRKIYLRDPDRKNPHDDAAVVVMTYGLRPSGRSLVNEAASIKTFKHIYGYNPVSASDWDIVRAIAYSGAKR